MSAHEPGRPADKSVTDYTVREPRGLYRVSKRMEVAGCHRLDLPYPSKCANMHGHNWIITVHCESYSLNESGMVMDFSEIKRRVHDTLDHQNLNEILPFNPTAENLARCICEFVPFCVRVDVQESEGNVASYERAREEDDMADRNMHSLVEALQSLHESTREYRARHHQIKRGARRT